MKRHLLQLLEVATVGLPFCAFKILSGMICLARPWLAPLGWMLIALGCADLIINAVNLVPLAMGRPGPLGVCLGHIVARRWSPDHAAWHELGISLDVLLSFGLVALVIGCNSLPTLPPAGLRIWSLAVILNVLGAGFGRLSTSLESLREAPGPARRTALED